jgi:hypothetical protein
MKAYINWVFSNHTYKMTLDYTYVHAINSLTWWVKNNKKDIESYSIECECSSISDEIGMTIKRILK